jgi:twitching motility protein PilT
MVIFLTSVEQIIRYYCQYLTSEFDTDYIYWLAMNLNELITVAGQKQATDVFITADAFPAFRIKGEVEIISCLPRLSEADCQGMAYGLMTSDQISRFECNYDLDLSFAVPEVAKIRANVYMQRGSIAMAMRLIPIKVPTLADLSMPNAVAELAESREGLILVTGPTGSGKSSTLAAMLNEINQSRKCHIITIEDPIEYSHVNAKSIISQRQIGNDVGSFNDALRYVLRQSPDVILVGEMRDVETVYVAMAASETGHLVLSTLHTSSAPETLERLTGMFQPHERDHVGIRLSASLRGIVSQRLLNRAHGGGRIAATEIMLGTPSIAALLQTGSASEIHDAMAEGAFWGMHTMNQCLIDFVKSDIITIAEAEANSPDQAELRQLLRQAGKAA